MKSAIIPLIGQFRNVQSPRLPAEITWLTHGDHRLQHFRCPCHRHIMEDEDEFVDAVDGTEENNQPIEDKEEDHVEDDDAGSGDDDFGDFGDFTAEAEDDGDEEQVLEEYDPQAEDIRRSDESRRQKGSAAEQSTQISRNLPPVFLSHSTRVNDVDT